MIGAPLFGLPHNGTPPEPDLTEDSIRAVIVHLALIDQKDERKKAIRDFAVSLVGAKSAALEREISAHVEALRLKIKETEEQLAEAKDGVAKWDPSRVVTTSERLVKRDMWALIMTFLAFLVVGILAFSEPKFLSVVLLNASYFSLDRTRFWDLAFAMAVAAMPLAAAAAKYAAHDALQLDVDRTRSQRALIRSAVTIGLPLWIVGFVGLLAFRMVPGGSIVDVDERSSVYAAIKTVIGELVMLVTTDLRQVFAAILVTAILYSTSAVIAAIAVSHRETYRRSMKEHAYVPAGRQLAEAKVEALINELQKLIAQAERFEGVAHEIRNLESVVEAKVTAEVELVVTKMKAAGLNAALQSAAGGGKIVDLPLFHQAKR